MTLPLGITSLWLLVPSAVASLMVASSPLSLCTQQHAFVSGTAPSKLLTPKDWRRRQAKLQQSSFLPHKEGLCHPFHRFDFVQRRMKFGRDTPEVERQMKDMSEFEACLETVSGAHEAESILERLRDSGFASTDELYHFAVDFEGRPESLSTVLRSDFGLIESPILPHKARSALLELVRRRRQQDESHEILTMLKDETAESEYSSDFLPSETLTDVEDGAGQATSAISTQDQVAESESKQEARPLFKSVVVNAKAKSRFQKASKNVDRKANSYGLAPLNIKETYPILAQEMDDFMTFMTQPTAIWGPTQESPIRQATATVYIRHAKLFLGWFLKEGWKKQRGGDSLFDETTDVAKISIHDVFPNSDTTTAQSIVDFILWLRQERQISDSYEANLLRGLTKLLKFRFARESTGEDASGGAATYSDIPAVRELRRLHRDANRRQKLSPRSSDEKLKWMSWSEYLSVVSTLRSDLEDELEKYEKHRSDSAGGPGNADVVPTDKEDATNDVNDMIPKFTATQRRIATKYQYYLVLAFFVCVPDRQRTMRELEIGRSLLREDGYWTIKHGPDDYKTGSTYGDRPPMVLSPELTPAIDDFLERWRPCLRPDHDFFFVQPRTGQPFTQDSMYAVVARCCYNITGKKTNPHLLRDIIVTHVRESSDATEKELEALALYMGHSIAMQRSSYDRRTLTQKVAPAVELLRTVNVLSTAEGSRKIQENDETGEKGKTKDR